MMKIGYVLPTTTIVVGLIGIGISWWINNNKEGAENELGFKNRLLELVLGALEKVDPMSSACIGTPKAMKKVRDKALTFPIFQPSLKDLQEPVVEQVTVKTSYVVTNVDRSDYGNISNVVNAVTYTPINSTTDKTKKIIFLHGGLFVFGRPETSMATDLARDLGITVVSVDIPHSPENMYDTVAQVTLEVVNHIAKGHYENLVLVGPSSSAHAVAVLSQQLTSQDPPVFVGGQLLFLPLLERPPSPNSCFWDLQFGVTTEAKSKDDDKKALEIVRAKQQASDDPRCSILTASNNYPSPNLVENTYTMIVQGLHDDYLAGSQSFIQKWEAIARKNLVYKTVPATHMGGLLRLDKEDMAYQNALTMLRNYFGQAVSTI